MANFGPSANKTYSRKILISASEATFYSKE